MSSSFKAVNWDRFLTATIRLLDRFRLSISLQRKGDISSMTVMPLFDKSTSLRLIIASSLRKEERQISFFFLIWAVNFTIYNNKLSFKIEWVRSTITMITKNLLGSMKQGLLLKSYSIEPLEGFGQLLNRRLRKSLKKKWRKSTPISPILRSWLKLSKIYQSTITQLNCLNLWTFSENA